MSMHIDAAYRIANAAVIADIESGGRPFWHGSIKWYDISNMIEPNEHAPEAIDMARLAIDYAISMRLVVQHPNRPNCLRVFAPGA